MAEGKAKRVSHEDLALAPFEAEADRTGLTAYRRKNNPLPGAGKNLQFGDLRVDMPERHILVEVESGGGVTNLVKYWFALENGHIKQPITLLHIYRQTSDGDYQSHMTLWRFFDTKMRECFPTRYESRLYTYRDPATDLIHPLEEFRRLISPVAATGYTAPSRR